MAQEFALSKRKMMVEEDPNALGPQLGIPPPPLSPGSGPCVLLQPQACNGNRTWSPARYPSECVTTCDNPNRSETCDRDCSNPGCECIDGFVSHKGGCIPVESCAACDGNTCPNCCEVSATGAAECVGLNEWTLTCSKQRLCSGNPDDALTNCPSRSDIKCVEFGNTQSECFVIDAPGICVIENTITANCTDNSECANGEVCIDIGGNGCCPIPGFPNPLGPGVPCPKKCYRVLKEDEIVCLTDEYFDPTTQSCLPIPTCDDDKVFDECGRGPCAPSCDIFGNAPDIICSTQCQPGCYCPTGTKSFGTFCIPDDTCSFIQRWFQGRSAAKTSDSENASPQSLPHKFELFHDNNLSETQLISMGAVAGSFVIIVALIIIYLIIRYVFKYKFIRHTKGYNSVNNIDIENTTDYSSNVNIKE